MKIQTLIGGILTRAVSDHVNAMALVANAVETQAMPAGFNFVVLSCTSNFYAKVGGNLVTVTIPGDTADGTAGELSPSGYRYDPAEHTKIAVISPVNSIITLSYYNIGGD